MRTPIHIRARGRIRGAAVGLSAAALLTTLTTALTTGITTGAAASGPACTPSWRMLEAPAEQAPYSLWGVDAVSEGNVWFAGSATALGASMMHWDGRSVTAPAAQIPMAPKTTLSVIGGSFDSATHGWARSHMDPRPYIGNPQGSLARWQNGRWTLTPTAVSPDASVSAANVVDVASLSEADAWAVGQLRTADSSSAGAVTEHWNGQVWQLAGNPMASRANALLSSLDAVSATDLWTVGTQRTNDGSATRHPLIMHYDGTRWTESPAPDVRAPGELMLVSATGADDVWAAGWQAKEGTAATRSPMLTHWDGTRWTLLPGPADAADGAYPIGLFAAGPDDVWMIAIYPGRGNVVLHWNGTAWTEVTPHGAAPDQTEFLYTDIDGTGPNDVWAVGVERNGSGWNVPAKPLIAHLSCGRR